MRFLRMLSHRFQGLRRVHLAPVIAHVSAHALGALRFVLSPSKGLLARPAPFACRQVRPGQRHADVRLVEAIAAVNGVAYGGGCELALACDIRIAAENARFAQLEMTVGAMPGGGAAQRLPRLIPRCKAAEMLLMGRIIDAQEAYRIGLVNAVVPLEQLMPTALKWAEEICQLAPLAVRATKEAMLRGSDMTLENGLLLDKLLFEKISSTEDFEEGIRAFKEKRKPVFKGR